MLLCVFINQVLYSPFSFHGIFKYKNKVYCRPLKIVDTILPGNSEILIHTILISESCLQYYPFFGFPVGVLK